MKELKFRAFYKPRKKMFNVGMIDFKNKVIIEDAENKHWFHECELMQYTGLKDCEGGEIFEGDIVKDLRDDNSLRYGDGNNLSPVEFHQGSFGVSIIYDGIFTPISMFTEDYRFKVIGNIYQNPEILGS